MDKENKLTPTSHTKQSKGQPLRELATALATAKSRPASFMASVVSISEDQSIAKVKLCTGAIFDVPVSILKDVIHLGTMTSGANAWVSLLLR